MPSSSSATLLFLLATLSLLSLTYCQQSGGRAESAAVAPTAPAGMAWIPGGLYWLGSDQPSRDEDSGRTTLDEAPLRQVELSPFFIDIYEVTTADYHACVGAGGCSRGGPNYRGYSRPEQPIVGITWYQADAFCRFYGKRLPSEAEWEAAARGPDGESFPWGDEPISCERAIIEEDGIKGCGSGTTADVGSRPAGRFGLFDMAGNSWEWVQDWYTADRAGCTECGGVDPRGPCGGAEPCPGFDRRTLKGGSWWWPGEYARSANRRAHFPHNRPFHHYGFRCAADLKRNPLSKE